MYEARPTYDNEIDLFEFFETLWHGRSKIISITFVAAVIGFIFSVVKPNNYEVSTPIQSAEESVFLKYTTLNNLLKESNFKINNKSIFKTFIVEFNDYEEMIDILSKNDFVKKSINGLDEIDRQTALINFAKKFKIIPPSDIEPNWFLKFVWHNDYEGRILFNGAIQKTLINIQKASKKNVDELVKAIEIQNLFQLEKLRNELNLTKQNLKERVKKRIKYLNEQSAIATELGIETNILDANGLSHSSQNGISLSVISNDVPFYLRGFKAINKEIALIENRSEEEFYLMGNGILELQEKIMSLEGDLSSSHLTNAAKLIQSDNVGNWIEFDLSLANSKSQKNSTLFYIAVAILLGGIIGMIYVFILNAVRKRNDNLTKV